MAKILIIFTFFALSSCKDRKLQQYERIVQNADRFEIYYWNNGKTMVIPTQQVENFKEILTRNVKPELQRKFINDVRVDFYKNSNRIAFLRITNGKASPFVNFNSDSLNFGFRLTYGLGMTIDDMNNR